MGPADYDLRPLGAPADLRDVGLQPLAVAVRLRGNLLRLREERLDLAQVEQRVPMGVLLDDPRDDVALAARELLVRELTLGVAELLVNDLLRGLGPDPALELVGDLDLALAFGVPLLIELLLPHAHLTGLWVHLRACAEPFFGQRGVLLAAPRRVGGGHGLLEPLEDGLEGDALLARQLPQRRDQFRVHLYLTSSRQPDPQGHSHSGDPLAYRLDRPALGASYLPDPPTQTPSEPI